MKIVLGARREDQLPLALVRGLSRSGNPLDGEAEVVDGRALVAGEVLDRAAGEAHPDGVGHGLSDSGRVVGEAVHQVGRDGDVHRVDDAAALGQRLLPADRAVEAARASRRSRCSSSPAPKSPAIAAAALSRRSTDSGTSSGKSP